ncbi:MAG: cupin domain-containing protein [Candidatus Competibacteraceae bacterium]|nr:cupin domain-containing protein [Candidatus Competibacteraceae bacterium]
MALVDINPDLGRRAVVDTEAMEWQPSPSDSVWRKPLFRTGGESGPVTSVVSYKPGGRFSPHAHPQGEEILVLEGTFGDDLGLYPSGTYLLNPDGSRHAPFSQEGCTLLVRLRQYAGADRPRLVVDTGRLKWLPGAARGLWVKPLYSQEGYPERMALVRWEAGVVFRRRIHRGGEEIFVLSGGFEDELGHYPRGTWIRNVQVGEHTPYTREGCVLYIREGGLLQDRLLA